MIILDATTRTAEVLLEAAVTTNQLPIVASYVDNTTTTYTPGSSNIATNNTTAVTAVAAPAASTQRQVKLLTISNIDTAAATVTVRYNDNSTTRTLFKATLAVGDNLVYTDGEGFRVVDSSGNTKVTTNGSVFAPTGTSGGIPYYSSTTSLTSTALLTAGAVVVGGGAGTAPYPSGVTIDPSTNSIYGYAGKQNAQTGTTYTLQASDAGKIITLNNAASITVTCPNSLPVDFYCTLLQTGAGQVTVAAGTGATVNNFDGLTKTAGQYAALNLYVISNSGGSAAVYVSQGRMAA
jgi:hypothetical protein